MLHRLDKAYFAVKDDILEITVVEPTNCIAVRTVILTSSKDFWKLIRDVCKGLAKCEIRDAEKGHIQNILKEIYKLLEVG